MAILQTNWRTVDKRLGCWIFCHGVMVFFFKFGGNWTNFDVSTPFLMGRGGVVSVRERCPRWCRVRHPCHIRQRFTVCGPYCSEICMSCQKRLKERIYMHELKTKRQRGFSVDYTAK